MSTQVNRCHLIQDLCTLHAGEAPTAALLDCKASTGKLFIPEDTTAVAHGDQNLAISDFLSRVTV